MATWLHKDEKADLVEAVHVDQMLKDGWSVEKVKKPVKKAKKPVEKVAENVLKD